MSAVCGHAADKRITCACGETTVIPWARVQWPLFIFCDRCCTYLDKEPVRCLCKAQGTGLRERVKCTQCGMHSHPLCYEDRGLNVSAPFICALCVKPRGSEYYCSDCQHVDKALGRIVRHVVAAHGIENEQHAKRLVMLRAAPVDARQDPDSSSSESFREPDQADDEGELSGSFVVGKEDDDSEAEHVERGSPTSSSTSSSASSAFSTCSDSIRIVGDLPPQSPPGEQPVARTLEAPGARANLESAQDLLPPVFKQAEALPASAHQVDEAARSAPEEAAQHAVVPLAKKSDPQAAAAAAEQPQAPKQVKPNKAKRAAPPSPTVDEPAAKKTKSHEASPRAQDEPPEQNESQMLARFANMDQFWLKDAENEQSRAALRANGAEAAPLTPGSRFAMQIAQESAASRGGARAHQSSAGAAGSASRAAVASPPPAEQDAAAPRVTRSTIVSSDAACAVVDLRAKTVKLVPQEHQHAPVRKFSRKEAKYILPLLEFAAKQSNDIHYRGGLFIRWLPGVRVDRMTLTSGPVRMHMNAPARTFRLECAGAAQASTERVAILWSWASAPQLLAVFKDVLCLLGSLRQK